MASHCWAIWTPLLISSLIVLCVSEETLESRIAALEDKLAAKEKSYEELAHQVLLNNFYATDRIKSEGDSGLVAVRHTNEGSYNYHTVTTRDVQDFAGMHDHSLRKNVLGHGENLVVMNGVQFSTRHNDYEVVQASPTSRVFHATEPIPFPPVPDTVLSKETIQEQVDEMALYFKAFKLQDETIKPYKDFFLPTLCYLEGKWLVNTSHILEVPNSNEFFNFFRAKTYEDLHAQAELDSMSGAQYFVNEHTAILPRTILSIDPDTGLPTYGQWHYRILCHPIAEDLPTKYLRLEDDLSYRVPFHIPIEELYYSKGARFFLDDQEKPGFFEDQSLLDKLVNQIPGLDNDPNFIYEKDYLGRDTKVSKSDQSVLNRGFYNRFFYDLNRDLSRLNTRYRGYTDANLFVAMNEQPEVAPMNITFRLENNSLKKYTNLRFSWMIPLEIFYRTPLPNWNPHGVYINEGDPDSPEAKALVDWSDNSTHPWAGGTLKKFFLTPSSFYTRSYPWTKGGADDGYRHRYITTTIGPENPALLAPSGLYRLTPPITGGVETVRLNYPIMPLHVSGNTIMKELRSLVSHLSGEIKGLAEAIMENP